jgi:Na+/H+ antiporter NhaA
VQNRGDVLPHLLARALAAGRVAAGIGGLVAPGAALRAAAGDAGDDELTRGALRLAAARDLALGLGALLAARRGPGRLRGWTEAAVLADATDAVVIASTGLLRPRVRALGALVAGGGVAAGLWSARRL